MTIDRILVSGVAGFIGSHVAKEAVGRGFSVVGVDDLSRGHLSNVPKQVDFIQGDLNDDAVIRLLPRKLEVVMHLAGQSSGELSFENPISDLERNLMATIRLAEFARRVGARRFIHASSMSVYGQAKKKDAFREDGETNPVSFYGASKLGSEKYLKLILPDDSWTIFRMFNVYGPGQDLANLKQGMVSIYLSMAKNLGEITVRGPLSRVRDFIDITDVVDVWFHAMFDEKFAGKTINLGTGIATKVSSLIEMINRRLGPVKVQEAGGTPGDQTRAVADVKLLRSLGYSREFCTLESGLDRFVSALR